MPAMRHTCHMKSGIEFFNYGGNKKVSDFGAIWFVDLRIGVIYLQDAFILQVASNTFMILSGRAAV